MKMIAQNVEHTLPEIQVKQGWIAEQVKMEDILNTPPELCFSICKGSDDSGTGYAIFTNERPKFSPLTGEPLEYDV